MTNNQGQNLIDSTIEHFQPFYEEKLTVEDATDMVANFSGFVRLLLKLEEKRSQSLKNKE